tara:strand:- start:202 stop:738 length:537 start_codon:yes stop_codon:yes gene_type:complete
MACSLTKGRLDFSCKTLIGGISNIYVTEFDAGNFVPGDTTHKVKAAATDAPTFFQFELLNDGNTFDESNEVAKDAGTSTFTQTGTFVLKGQDDLSQEALKSLSKARTQVVVEYRDGSKRVAGIDFGADFTIGTTSGGAIGDMVGYNVAFTAVSANLAPFLEGSLTTGAVIDPVAEPIA